MIKSYAPFVFFTLLLFTSCRKSTNVQPGFNVTVSGRFSDPTNYDGYPNVKVRIGVFQKHQPIFAMPFFVLVGYADSTVTDTAGRYSITFKTEGDGRTYFFEYKGLPANVYVSPYSPTADGLYQKVQIDTPRATLVYNFDVYKPH
jgi:hypothetical protein